jgi:hypothetical protein
MISVRAARRPIAVRKVAITQRRLPLSALNQAFDEAWASIVHSIDATIVENARLSLAHRLLPTRACLELIICQL